MKRVSLLLMVVLTVVFCATAQNLTKLGVSEVKLQNMGEIVQQGQIRGYYNFYIVDDKDYKNNTYLISIMDENLHEIKSIEITKPAYYFLVEGVFNGEAFCFLFYDSRESQVELLSFDMTLNQTGSVVRAIKRRSFAFYNYSAITEGKDGGLVMLLAVPNKGFIYHNYPDNNEYEIEFLDHTLNKKWSSKARNDAGDKYEVEMADDAFQNDNYVGSLINKKTGFLSMDIDYELIVHEVETGKRVFSMDLQDKDFNLSISSVFFDETNKSFTILGEYFALGSKEVKSQSKGLFYKIIDSQGKQMQNKFVDWSEYSKSSALSVINEHIKNNIKFNIHEIVKTADGDIFVVAEEYKKVASHFEVLDMVIFHFDQYFTIKNINLFGKDKVIFPLPPGANLLSGKKLSYVARAYGIFNYEFTQTAKDKSTFIVTYINYDREKGEKAKNVFGAIVYTPEKTFVVDKIILNRKSTDYFVRKAKTGYVMVTEYFKKEKKLDMRLEKINY